MTIRKILISICSLEQFQKRMFEVPSAVPLLANRRMIHRVYFTSDDAGIKLLFGSL